jgi:hypothetical protein
MFHNSGLQQQPVHAQLIAFADANLDSAMALCERLCSKPEDGTYAHGAVVMSLAFHSLELFFKAGILKLTPQEQFGGRSGHDMGALSKRFFRLYPKKEFKFDVPFGREPLSAVGGLTSDEIAALQAFIDERDRLIPEDQRNRYPIDVGGKPWRHANFGFEPNMFLATLRELQVAYARIRPLLNAG